MHVPGETRCIPTSPKAAAPGMPVQTTRNSATDPSYWTSTTAPGFSVQRKPDNTISGSLMLTMVATWLNGRDLASRPHTFACRNVFTRRCGRRSMQLSSAIIEDGWLAAKCRRVIYRGDESK